MIAVIGKIAHLVLHNDFIADASKRTNFSIPAVAIASNNNAEMVL